MIAQIDHVVIVVGDLDRAVEDYGQLGFTVVPGGAHADGLTRNALIAFADGSYLELLAFVESDAGAARAHPWRARLDEGEGLEDYALLASDLDADLAAFGSVAIGEGGRRRPDGQSLRWRMARFRQEEGDHALPFVIQDVTVRDLRVPSGAATRHALPVTGIAGVTVAVRSLAPTRERLAALLGARANDGDSGRLRINGGGQWLDLKTPDDAGVAEYLARHGAGPYMLTLRGAVAESGESGRLLDLARTHGARIALLA